MSANPSFKETAPSTSEITPDNAASRPRLLESDGQTPQILYDQPWLTSFVRPLLIITLVSCCAFVFVTLVRRVVPSIPATTGLALLGLAILSATVATISGTILAQPEQRLQRTVGYRLAELGILLAITRLVLWLVYSGFPTFGEIMTVPLTTIFDGIFWAALFIIIISWSVAGEVTAELQQLALQADELFVAQHHYDRLGDIARTSSVDRRAVLNGFVWRWVTVGLLVLFLTALVRPDLPQQTSFTGVVGILRGQVESGVAIAVILYFICGLILIGLSQLALLRSRWLLEKTPMRSSILSNWPWYVALVVGGVAILATLLPLGDTFLLAKILNTIISAIFWVGWSIMQLIMALLAILFGSLGGNPAPTANNPAPPVVLPTPTPLPPSQPTLPEWTGGLIFWILMAFLLGNAALIYFGGKHLRLGWLRWLWAGLRLRWLHFLVNFRSWRQTVLQQVGVTSQPQRNEQDLDLAILTDRSLSPDTLSPAEQVRYFYLSLLHRAKEAGFPRQHSETPFRYAPRLHQAIDSDTTQPESVNEKIDEIELLTKNFVELRYGGKEASAQTLSQLHQVWEKLCKRLKDV
ncbi:MAG: DUF4129 domain-containing protein [Caldilineaceae bacterium]